jgi:hypothetical protein
MQSVIKSKQDELQRLLEDMSMGDYRGIQRHIIEATEGFRELFAVANGQNVNGLVPTVQEILAANKLLIERVLPQIRASQVMVNYQNMNKADALDSAESDARAKALLAEIEESLNV